MTAKHFRRAAEMVRAILDGEWTNDPPDWAERDVDCWPVYINDPAEADYNYLRAVQTAEAFILLFECSNPRFNRGKFLQQCGLRTE